MREYLPAAAETDARLAVPISALVSLLGDDRVSIVSVPVPYDCIYGLGGAYWRRPHAYLDDTVQAGMAYKLIEAAQARWRKVNAPELVALVRAGAIFHKGKLLERPTNITPEPMPPDDQTAGSEVA